MQDVISRFRQQASSDRLECTLTIGAVIADYGAFYIRERRLCGADNVPWHWSTCAVEDARTVETMKNCGFVCDPVEQEIYERARSRTAAPGEKNAATQGFKEHTSPCGCADILSEYS